LYFLQRTNECPRRDSNPRYGLERAETTRRLAGLFRGRFGSCANLAPTGGAPLAELVGCGGEFVRECVSVAAVDQRRVCVSEEGGDGMAAESRGKKGRGVGVPRVVEPGKLGSLRLGLAECYAAGALPCPVGGNGREWSTVGAAEHKLTIGGSSGCEAVAAQASGVLDGQGNLPPAGARLRGNERIASVVGGEPFECARDVDGSGVEVEAVRAVWKREEFSEAQAAAERKRNQRGCALALRRRRRRLPRSQTPAQG
jgi:hypothetical protein